mgnify:CR=1 FL=1
MTEGIEKYGVTKGRKNRKDNSKLEHLHLIVY